MRQCDEDGNIKPVWRQMPGCFHHTTHKVFGSNKSECENGWFYKYIILEEKKGEADIAGSDQIKMIVTEYLTYAIYEALGINKYTAGEPKFIRTCNGNLCQVTKYLQDGKDLYTVLKAHGDSQQTTQPQSMNAETSDIDAKHSSYTGMELDRPVDDENYAMNFLAMLAARHGDAKPKNIMLIKKKVGEVEKYELISIDHEMGLVRGGPKDLCKTALLGLPNFHQPIHPTIAEKLFDEIGTHPEEWLRMMASLQSKYEATIRNTITSLFPYCDTETYDTSTMPKLIEPILSNILDGTRKGIKILSKVISKIRANPLMFSLARQIVVPQMTYHLLLELVATSDGYRIADEFFTAKGYEGQIVTPYLSCVSCQSIPGKEHLFSFIEPLVRSFLASNKLTLEEKKDWANRKRNLFPALAQNLGVGDFVPSNPDLD